MVKELKILVLGNDPQINQIDFGRLDPSVITLGVNRIWLKHIPNFFFFNDFEILKELEMQPEVVKALVLKSQCFSSDWLNKSGKIKNLPDWVKVYNQHNKKSLPDSVTTAISIFKSRYLNYRTATFYVAGVSLERVRL